MNRERFHSQMRKLIELYGTGFKIDELMGSELTCEGYPGAILDAYGTFLLEETYGSADIPDPIVGSYWDFIITKAGEEVEDEELDRLYNLILE